jgi:outer membrane protein assembly factor BamB
MAKTSAKLLSRTCAGILGVFLLSCGGGSSSRTTPPPTTISVSLTPLAAEVLTGKSQQFKATATGTTNQNFTWSIEGAGGGNSTVGTISSLGIYTAPAVVPNPAAITVRATSLADSTRSTVAAVTITSPVEDWAKYRRDLANTGRSAETGLSSANAELLGIKWKFDTGAGVPGISASPAVATVGGITTVYVGTWKGTFFALDAATGFKRWSFTIDVISGCPEMNTRRIGSSAVVDNGIVFFGGANAYLYALDAATGTLKWKMQLGDPCQGYEIWSSPAVLNGVVYVGVASHESAPCVAGQVFAFRTKDGMPAWPKPFDTIDQITCPTPGTCLGAAVWSSPALDTKFNTLYVGTGNSGKGCSPSTENATNYPDGVIALDLTSGAFKDFFQAFPKDLNDEGDIGSSPVLHTTSQCPASGPVGSWVSASGKNGIVYTFPRDMTDVLGTPMETDLVSGELIASPALVPSNTSAACNNIFFPTEQGHLFDLRQASNGTISIHQDVPVSVAGGCSTSGSCPLFSAAASITDLLFIGSDDHNFYVYTTSGKRLLTVETGGRIASGPAISHSRVYFGSFDGFVYCLSINGQ